MKKLLLMIPSTIVLVFSLTLTSFASTSVPDNSTVSVNQPCQSNIVYTLNVIDYPSNMTGLSAPLDYKLFMDISSPVSSSGTTYSNVKLWNNSLGVDYSFRTAVSSSNGVNGITLSAGTSSDKIAGIRPNSSLSSSYFVINPDLTQGRLLANGISYTRLSSSTPDDDVLVKQEVIYNGTLLYPTTNGSSTAIPFSFGDTLYSGAYNEVRLRYLTGDYDNPIEYPATYPTTSHFGYSLAPSRLTYSGSADKLTSLEIFRIAYDTAVTNGVSGLVPPSTVDEYGLPVVFSTYNVSYTVTSASVNRATSAGETDVIDNFDTGILDFKVSSLNITYPSTPNGVPRAGESLTDFMSIIAPNTTPSDFGDFIVTILGGVLSVELFPHFYLYTVLAVVVAVSLITWLLKVFVGG